MFNFFCVLHVSVKHFVRLVVMGAVQINLIMLSITVISATPADDASSHSQNLLYWWLRTSPVLRTCPGKPPARWRGTASFATSLGEVMWPSAPRPVYGSSAQWHSWQQPPAWAAGVAGQEACYPADFRPVRPWEEMHTRRSPDSFAQVQSPPELQQHWKTSPLPVLQFYCGTE